MSSAAESPAAIKKGGDREPEPRKGRAGTPGTVVHNPKVRYRDEALRANYAPGAKTRPGTEAGERCTLGGNERLRSAVRGKAPVSREEVRGGKRAQAWQENSSPGEHLLQPSPPLGGRAHSKRGGGRKPRLGGRTPLPGRTTLPLPPQPRQVGSGRISRKKKADLPPRGSGGRKWGFFGLALCRTELGLG